MKYYHITSKLFQYFLAMSVICMLAFTTQVQATKAYTNATTLGNQNYSGSLGLEFMVNSSIIVYSLGVYDSGADGIADNLHSQLWKRTGASSGMIISPVVAFTSVDPGTLVGNYRFRDLLVPLILKPGTYVINSWGFANNIADKNGNTNPSYPAPYPMITGDTGGGLVTYTSSFYGPSAGAFPTIISSDGDPFHYAAGNFQFAVPEPGTYLTLGSLLGVALIAIAAKRRKVKRV